MRNLLIAVSLALVGCTQHPEPCPLWIDPSFSPEAKEGITKAVLTWQQVGVYIYVSPMADNADPHRIEPITEAEMAAEIAAHPLPADEQGETARNIMGETHNQRTFWGWTHEPIRIIVAHADEELQDHPNAYVATVMHELGHHLGLTAHSQNPEDIMFSHVPLDLDYVTPEAAHRWQKMYPNGNQ